MKPAKKSLASLAGKLNLNWPYSPALPQWPKFKFYFPAKESKGFSTKSRQKSTFLPYRVKKHHSTLEMDTFKVMLLLSYLASLDNKPRNMPLNVHYFWNKPENPFQTMPL